MAGLFLFPSPSLPYNKLFKKTLKKVHKTFRKSLETGANLQMHKDY